MNKVFIQNMHVELLSFYAIKYHQITGYENFEKLAIELNFNISPEEKGYDSDDMKYGTFPEDVFKYLVKNNINFRMSFYEDEWKEALKKISNYGNDDW